MQTALRSNQRLAQPKAVQTRRCRKAVTVRAVSEEVQTESAPADASSSKADGNEIYIGFEKGDYDRSAGRKGRVIRDDPKKYPAKETKGFFSGVTGGWAGGEVGLWELREEVKAKGPGAPSSSAAKPAKAAAAAAAPAPAAPKADKGADKIYLGYAKDELELRKSGAPGRMIVDKAEKYPGKEDLGLLIGATGGFAGGEKGLKQYVETGEVRLRQPNEPGRNQFSPVSLAFLLLAAGAGGGLLLNGATDLVEGGLESQLAAPIDSNTKTLLLAAMALLTSAGLVGAGRAAVSSFNERMREGATNLVTLGVFWLVIFFAARAVLEL